MKTIFFSATGGTEQVARLLSLALKSKIEKIDILANPGGSTDGDSNEEVMLVAPVYGGRLPQMAANYFSQLNGNGRKAIAVVVYGNRDYDDALLELCDIASKAGFKIVGAGVFVAQHSIFPKVATDRPDMEDVEKMREFAKLAKASLNSDSILDLSKIKGKRPYKPLMKIPFHPRVNKNFCTNCKICVAACPVGAVSVDDPTSLKSDICMACGRCIKACPHDARSFGGVLYRLVDWKFSRDNQKRKEPEWFF